MSPFDVPERGPGGGIDEPPVMVDERAALQAFLDRQRELVVWKLHGCDAATLQSVSTPSGMTPLGVLAHLTDVERSWWREQAVLDPGLPSLLDPDDPGAIWRVGPDADPAALVRAYVEECRACDAAVAGLPLDRPCDRAPMTLRWVYLHLIEETARHLGQLDLLRERADGTTGEDPFGGGEAPA